MSESPRDQQVTRYLTWTLGWGGGGQRGSWVPEGGHSPKGGQSRNAAFGNGGFIGNLCQPSSTEGRQGWQSFHVNSRVDRGQDVAMVRLSPEKGHWGARGGGIYGSPMLADECQSSPSHSSSAPPPIPGRQSPMERVGSSGNGCSPSPSAAT